MGARDKNRNDNAIVNETKATGNVPDKDVKKSAGLAGKTEGTTGKAVKAAEKSGKAINNSVQTTKEFIKAEKRR